MDRWNELFEQLEANANSDRFEEMRETADQVTRAELSKALIADRLRAHIGQPIALRTAGDCDVEGIVSRVESEWLLLTIERSRVLVPMRSVVAFFGLTPRMVVAPSALCQSQPLGCENLGVEAISDELLGNNDRGAHTREVQGAQASAFNRLTEFSLNRVLREICRDRELVIVHVRGAESQGIIDRVGADHFDIVDVAAREWNRGGLAGIDPGGSDAASAERYVYGTRRHEAKGWSSQTARRGIRTATYVTASVDFMRLP